ncbi:MAG: DUF559 domain-containing protein [Chloroflexi bacterium]|nr:DUF559 domain-containing protein [Chloroflexota bacterium]
MVDRDYNYAPQKQIEFAKQLRRNATDAEVLLWSRLRRRQLGGYRFRRQHPIGPYIADFACVAERLVIELDGGQHADRNQEDEARTLDLEALGFRVLRFWNDDVLRDLDSVVERVASEL